MILNRIIIVVLISLFSHLSFALDTQIYAWTDEKGVHHYAEEPPDNVANVESRVLNDEDVNTAYAIPEKTVEKPAASDKPPKPPKKLPIMLNPDISPQPRVLPRAIVKPRPARIKPAPTLATLTINNPYVSDFGELLLPEDNDSIQMQLAQFRAKTGIHLSLVTVFKLQDYADQSVATVSQQLLEKKAYGQRSVLLLIALLDKKAGLAFSADYPQSDIKQIRAMMKKTLFPHFRENNFNQGIVQGVPNLLASLAKFSLKQQPVIETPIVEVITEKPVEIPIAAPPAPIKVEPAQTTAEFSNLHLIYAVVITLILVIVMIIRPARRQRHQCPQCHAKTESCLDLPNTTAGLAPAPTTHSYSVWRCPRCATHVYWAEQFD